MAKVKSTGSRPAADKAKVADQGALGASIAAMGNAHGEAVETDEAMPDNASTMHAGLHDMHDAAQHFDGDIHGEDQWPADWKPPTELEAPPARSGFVQRWVRMTLKGQNDGNNLSNQARQGWRPRTLESVPEGSRKSYPTMKDPRTGGTVIINGDLILCEMPKRLADQQSAYFAAKRLNQVAALVDKPLASAAVPGGEKQGFGAPHVAERHSRTSTGRAPSVASD